MQSCNACASIVTTGATDCAVCGALVKPEPMGPGSDEAIDPSLGHIANLFKGNCGLTKTYWLYGVLAGWILGPGFVMSFGLTPRPIIVGFAFLILSWGYLVFITVAISRAAMKYPGSQIWHVVAILSNFVGILLFVDFTLFLVEVLGY